MSGRQIICILVGHQKGYLYKQCTQACTDATFLGQPIKDRYLACACVLQRYTCDFVLIGFYFFERLLKICHDMVSPIKLFLSLYQLISNYTQTETRAHQPTQTHTDIHTCKRISPNISAPIQCYLTSSKKRWVNVCQSCGHLSNLTLSLSPFLITFTLHVRHTIQGKIDPPTPRLPPNLLTLFVNINI